MEDLLKVGVITTTHGVRGEVKVYPTTDEPERFLDLEYVLLDTGKELRRLDIKNVRFFKNLVILKFDGIDNINDIEKYKGRDLWIPREEAHRPPQPQCVEDDECHAQLELDRLRGAQGQRGGLRPRRPCGVGVEWSHGGQ